jgi:arginine deiminase
VLQRNLHRYTGRDDLHLTAIFCDGHDSINQDREQWTDSANVLALGTSVVVGYDRNVQTFEALSQHGYRLVAAQRILDDPALARKIAAELEAAVPSAHDRSQRRKYAIAIPASELSRARGGLRCMTMPLVREPMRWVPVSP